MAWSYRPSTSLLLLLPLWGCPAPTPDDGGDDTSSSANPTSTSEASTESLGQTSEADTTAGSGSATGGGPAMCDGGGTYQAIAEVIDEGLGPTGAPVTLHNCTDALAYVRQDCCYGAAFMLEARNTEKHINKIPRNRGLSQTREPANDASSWLKADMTNSDITPFISNGTFTAADAPVDVWTLQTITGDAPADAAFARLVLITGDITQIDLPTGASGLRLVTRILDRVDDIHFATLTSEDVVRHSLVGKIVDAYTEYDAKQQAGRFERQQAREPNPEGANRAERRGRPPQDHRPAGPERPRGKRGTS